MFKTYQDVQQYLGTKTDRPYPHGRATRVQKRDEGIAIKYHDTDVVLFTPEYVELNSGGWRTHTTKARMNENLDRASLWQERGVWYMSLNGHWGDKDTAYFDGIRLSYDGDILNPRADDAEAFRVATLTKQINEYVTEFVAKLQAGDIETPSGADCWFCAMTDQTTGKPLGDTDPDHLLEHLNEKYYVPSLVMNAVKEHGSIANNQWLVGKLWFNDTPWDFMEGVFVRDTKRALVAYLKLRLAVGR